MLYDGAAGGTTAASGSTTLGATQGTDTGNTATAADGSTALTGAITLLGTTSAVKLSTAPADGDTLTVNGKTITFRAGIAPASSSVPSGSGVSGHLVTDGGGNTTVYLGDTNTTSTLATVSDVLTAIDLASGVKTSTISSGAATIGAASAASPSAVAGGAVVLKSSTGADLSVTGNADFLKELGLTTATGGGNATVTANRTSSSSSLGALVSDGSTLNVDGHIITFKNAPVPGSTNAPAIASGFGVSGNVQTDGNGNSTVYLQGGSVNDVLKAIDLATGVQTASIGATGTATLSTASGQINSSINASGQLKLSTGVNADLSVTGTGNALNVLGLAGNAGTQTAFTAAGTSGIGGMTGKTLTCPPSTAARRQRHLRRRHQRHGRALDRLRTELQANNLTATTTPTAC